MEPTAGIEPATSSLPRMRSTTELRRLHRSVLVGREGFEPSKAFSQRIYSPLLLAT